jgi:hypothetical protein
MVKFCKVLRDRLIRVPEAKAIISTILPENATEIDSFKPKFFSAIHIIAG